MEFSDFDMESAKPFVLPVWNAVVKTWLEPALGKLKQGKNHTTLPNKSDFATTFEDYLKRSYDKHSFITTVVFQNQQKALSDLYIPLTVVNEEDSVAHVVDTFHESLVPKYKKVLIADSAGMGKSTLLKLLFLKCMEANAGIPILIELRQLRPSFTILDSIQAQIDSIDGQVDQGFVLRLIQNGKFVFFLDGFDEIPSTYEADVVRDINSFIDKAHENLFVLASRPEKALVAFNNFKKFGIQPLSNEQAFELLLKYGKGSEIAKTLIEKIQEPQYQRIGEFLSNPLLVSLLYRSYEYKATIPLKKHVFYRQVFDSLYEEHDITKDAGFRRDKYSNLDIDDFHKVLRTLGFFTSKRGEVEYTKDDLLKLINQTRDALPGIIFNSNDFLKDLLLKVPLFVQDGHQYRWTHKSIQDYFSAQYICLDTKENQGPIMEKIAFDKAISDKYINILDLCHDIDYGSFRKFVLYPLAQKYIAFHENSYQQIKDNRISNEAIKRRKELTYDRDIFIIPGFTYRKYFDEDETQRVAQFFEDLKRYGSLIEANGGWVISTSKINDVAVAQSRTSLDGLLRLLHNKRNVLVFLASKEDYKEIRLTLSFGEIVKLDSRAESETNLPSHFEEVNQFVLARTAQEEFLLNIDECVSLVSDVEADKKRETVEFYLDGL